MRYAHALPFHQADIGNDLLGGFEFQLEHLGIGFLPVPLAQGADGLYRLAECVGDLGQKVTVRAGHELKLQAFGVEADGCQDFLGNVNIGQGIIVTVGDIIAFVQFAASDEHAVLAVDEGSQDELQVDTTGTHHTDQSHFIGIL
ncbi:hypothetical protein DESC_350089 [Desulfosarcina cetonica]|nr:hypothetical protein DESC_350089 [Desulfosarcina cetonica]